MFDQKMKDRLLLTMLEDLVPPDQRRRGADAERVMKERLRDRPEAKEPVTDPLVATVLKAIDARKPGLRIEVRKARVEKDTVSQVAELRRFAREHLRRSGMGWKSADALAKALCVEWQRLLDHEKPVAVEGGGQR